ncbi:MAG: hypothetical protein AAB874_03885, partial [Patescibacteria group bacterium]
KYIADHASDWQIRYQRKSILTHKQSLAKALNSGDKAAIKVQRAMIVFGNSVMNSLAEKLRKINST